MDTETGYIDKIQALGRASRDVCGNDPQLALSYAKQALELSEKSGYARGIAYSLLLAGVACEKLSLYEEGLASLFKSLGLYRELGDKTGEANALNSIGIYYFFLSKFQDSLDSFQSCLEVAREIGYRSIEIRCLNNIGEIYREFGKLEQALANYSTCMKVAEESGDEMMKGTLLMNIGHLKYAMGHLEEAAEVFGRSMDIFRKIGEKLFEAESLNKLGEIYLDSGNIEASMECLNKSHYICRELENKYLETSVLRSFARVCAKRDMPGESLQYLQAALSLANEIQAVKTAADLHLELTNAYENTRDYKEALQHYKEYNSLMKSVTDEEFEKKIQAASLQSRIEQAQSEAEIYRLKNIELKQQADIIEANARELEKSYKNMHVISEIGRNITSSLDIEDILNTLYESMNLLMDASCFGVGVYNKRKGLIDYRFFMEDKSRLPAYCNPVSSRESLAAWCIRNRKALTSNDILNEWVSYLSPEGSDRLDKNIKSVIYCPLMVKNDVTGVITVQSHYKNAYSDYDLSTVNALASYVAIALNNSAKSEELKDKAVLLAKQVAIKKHAQGNLVKANRKLKVLLSVDVVTGISNRRSFERLARQVWKQAEANLLPLSILIIDIDFFKQYNDAYGHLYGDKCLRKAGLCLQESVRRPEDFVARYGGEEFAVLLPDTSPEDALITAERLRQKIENLKIPHKASSVNRFVTVSIGVSNTVPEGHSGLKQLIAHADKALYEAKNSGRNCVRMHAAESFLPGKLG